MTAEPGPVHPGAQPNPPLSMNDPNSTQADTLPFPMPAPRQVRPPTWRVTNADAFSALREIEPVSIDAVITDPPYGIGFMNRKWDTFETENQPGTSNAAFQAWTQRWAELALVASKPGANWIVAGSPQTNRCGLNEATARATEMAEEEPGGKDTDLLVELLRRARELVVQVERLPTVLTATAAIVAIELQASEVNRLRGLLADSYDSKRTTATYVRAPGRVLSEAYAGEPDEPRTIN